MRRFLFEKSFKGEYDVWDSVFFFQKQFDSIFRQQLESAKLLVEGMVWDNNDNPSKWSEPAKWTIGLLSKDEWTGVWIEAPWQGKRICVQPMFSIEYATQCGSGRGQAQRQRQPHQPPQLNRILCSDNIRHQQEIASELLLVLETRVLCEWH